MSDVGHPRPSVLLASSLAMLAALGGCSSEPTVPRCIPGAAVACTCVDGRVGSQTCRESGSFEVCACAGGVDAGVDVVDGSSPSDVGGPDVPAVDLGDALALDAEPRTDDVLIADAPAMDMPAMDTPAMPDVTPPPDAPLAPDVPTTDATAPDAPAIADASGGLMCAPGLCNIAEVSGSDQFGSFARLTTGQVYRWSYCVATTCRMRAAPTATRVDGISDATQISVGVNHACVLERSTTGRVRCWGANDTGQLGNGTMGVGVFPTPGLVLDVTDAVQISAGYWHTCVRRMTGAVQCWGQNAFGALGDGTTMTIRSRAATVLGITDATQVFAGLGRSCALRASGGLWCWGENSNGELGDGTRTTRRAPVRVVGLDDAVSVAMGSTFTCALRAGGTVVCWGLNTSGELGIGASDSEAHLSPGLAVVGLSSVIEMSAGYQHTCARLAAGGVRCWGRNTGAQLGTGTRALITGLSVVDGVPDAIHVSSAREGEHACAYRAIGRLLCWGRDVNGFGFGDAPSEVVGFPLP